MRGEYWILPDLIAWYTELPPRARRIHGTRPAGCVVLGTTSACAENTAARASRILLDRNYLRVRGEYRVSPVRGCTHSELPPRARRIPHTAQLVGTVVGTTSACAENTWSERQKGKPSWNYLRVRGEYKPVMRFGYQVLELPPRARRIPNLSGGAV